MGDIIRADGGSLSFDSSESAALQSGTTQNVAGSWYEVIAATSFDAVSLTCDFYIGDGGGGWIDLGVGAAASEIVIAEKFRYDLYNSNYYHNQFTLPIQIPKGTRIAARHANSSGTADRYTYARVHLFGGGDNTPPPFQLCELIGRASPTNSGTIDVYGSYAQISASLPESYGAIIIGIDDDSSSTFFTTRWHYKLALGASSSEVDILTDFRQPIDSNSDQVLNGVSAVLPIALPKGERLSVKSTCDRTTSTGLNFSIWGFR